MPVLELYYYFFSCIIQLIYNLYAPLFYQLEADYRMRLVDGVLAEISPAMTEMMECCQVNLTDEPGEPQLLTSFYIHFD